MGELRIRAGDYLPNGQGGMEKAHEREALLERVLFRLKARRGGFALMPELGSRLYLLAREKPSAQESAAMSYVAEALAEESVTVERVKLVRQEGGRAALTVWLEWRGERLAVETEIG